MTKDVFGKHMVWTEHPTTKAQIGIGYSSLTEAEAEAVKLEQAGYSREQLRREWGGERA